MTKMKDGKMTIEEAKLEGFTVDTTTYPHFAYKGARFNPDVAGLCYTALEGELLRTIRATRNLLDNALEAAT